jgi:hypothetical protein
MKYAWVLFGIFFLILGSHFSLEAKNYDYGDFTSNTLITKASGALDAEDWDTLDAYTTKCIRLYQGEARRMQKKLKSFLAADVAHSQWALNHVAYSHFLRGQMFEKQKKLSKSSEEYATCIRKYGFAQAWDPKTNAFWKIAQEAQKSLNRLKNSSL